MDNIFVAFPAIAIALFILVAPGHYRPELMRTFAAFMLGEAVFRVIGGQPLMWAICATLCILTMGAWYILFILDRSKGKVHFVWERSP